MTRYVLTCFALGIAATSASAQAAKSPATKTAAPTQQVKPQAKPADTKAPATKAPATVPATKAPATVPATKAPATVPATKAPATVPATKAQATKAPATKAPATKAADTKTPATPSPDAKAAGTKAPAPPTAGAKTGSAGAPPARQVLVVAPETVVREKVPVIMREVFEYDPEGRRDPFFSLLATSELRPALVDLRLTGLIYDPSGRRSVAIMRDIKDNTQYRVTTGMQLGRMRVALIRPRSVIFSIEEFGLNRQDSLVLGDTTKVRAK